MLEHRNSVDSTDAPTGLAADAAAAAVDELLFELRGLPKPIGEELGIVRAHHAIGKLGSRAPG